MDQIGLSQDIVNAAIDLIIKTLTMVIRVQGGRAKFQLNWNVYNISINCAVVREQPPSVGRTVRPPNVFVRGATRRYGQ